MGLPLPIFERILELFHTSKPLNRITVSYGEKVILEYLALLYTWIIDIADFATFYLDLAFTKAARRLLYTSSVDFAASIL